MSSTRPKKAGGVASAAPPMFTLALVELDRALYGPLDTTLTQRRPAREMQQAKPGRPTAVQPSHVVVLVRFLRLGHSLRVAASKSGLTHQQAARLLTGKPAVCKHPHVLCAGIFLPDPTVWPRPVAVISESKS